MSFVQQRLAKLVERLEALKAGLDIASHHHQNLVQWAQLAASDYGSIQRDLSQAVEMHRLLKVLPDASHLSQSHTKQTTIVLQTQRQLAAYAGWCLSASTAGYHLCQRFIVTASLSTSPQ